jgi:hypothetical protein
MIYLGFFFIDPALSHHPLRLWLLDGAGTLVFLFLYLGLFFLENPYPMLHIGGMVALGIVSSQSTPEPARSLSFAAAMLPFTVQNSDSRHDWAGRDRKHRRIVDGLLLHVNGWTFLFFGLSRPDRRGQYFLRRAQSHELSCARPTKRSSIWPRSPSANALPAICMTFLDTRCR